MVTRTQGSELRSQKCWVTRQLESVGTREWLSLSLLLVVLRRCNDGQKMDRAISDLLPLRFRGFFRDVMGNQPSLYDSVEGQSELVQSCVA